jgi:hypothetical protein
MKIKSTINAFVGIGVEVLYAAIIMLAALLICLLFSLKL